MAPVTSSSDRHWRWASLWLAVLAAAPLVRPAPAAASAPSEANPQNSPAARRFAQGLELAHAHQVKTAIDVFARLTRDYPDLPEPFVQLASLYAQSGDLHRAAEALQTALALRADASIDEALGDVYARLAAEAYTRALKAGAPAQRLQPKLRDVTDIEAGADAAGTPAPAESKP